jgi:hypothetical protein
MPPSAPTVSVSLTPELQRVVTSRLTDHRLLFEFSSSWFSAAKLMRKLLARQSNGTVC